MARYAEKRYRSFDEFRTFETPTFDHLSDAIDGLMDALFLDEVRRYAPSREEEDLFDRLDGDPDYSY